MAIPSSPRRPGTPLSPVLAARRRAARAGATPTVVTSIALSSALSRLSLFSSKASVSPWASSAVEQAVRGGGEGSPVCRGRGAVEPLRGLSTEELFAT